MIFWIDLKRKKTGFRKVAKKNASEGLEKHFRRIPEAASQTTSLIDWAWSI